ncbi:ABC transporter permease [Pusillimonas sp. CC-YST705]|uniref:ABC transporter permease n=1 Tax=Mesopusillimonas faecipullorum TaxID=2755040 RepID=A0ABS8CDN7_9BURK|nr:ABC transporter permease [Mesopusillimonas faecipullorum]MCB5364148.1 ABC transporter permease [Mesopusillimonas faecipullorum]
MTLLQRLRIALDSLLLLLAIVGLWWLASHQGWVSRAFLPTPETTWNTLVRGLSQGDLLAYTGGTVQRMLVGWLLASLIGIALGALIGISQTIRPWLQPTLEFIRPLPASAIMPLAIAIFGLSDTMILFVVAFGSMWPVLLATIHGFASVEPRLREVATALQLGRLQFILKIGLPSALPDILAGMRLSMTVALIIAIVGEMLSSQAGLGQAVLLAARAFRAGELFAGILLLGVVGLVANLLLAKVEKHFLRWMQPQR